MKKPSDGVDHSKEIQTLVKQAKEYEKEGQLKECKFAYLDAADLSLEMAKTSNFINKLSYENITRALIQHAKDIQEEMNLLKDGPLPSPPSAAPQKVDKKEKRPFDPDKDLMFVESPGLQPIKPKLDIPKIHQLIAIKEGGVPLLSHNFEDISKNTTAKLNEILFSGAITAVNQLMQEVLEKPIQTITFEDGILLIRAIGDLYYVLYADEDSEELSNVLSNFCEEFYGTMEALINECLHTGKVLSDDVEVVTLINRHFVGN